MDSFWTGVDLDATIRDYDFTGRALRSIRNTGLLNETATFEASEGMAAKKIFTCLLEEMEIVSFGDHLKRYLYLNAELKAPFREVPEETYADLIRQSFEETFTPHSFEPTTRRWTASIRDWLQAQSVRRQTVFLLGFGLRMDVNEVSDFLMKVNKDVDFDPLNAEEVIYRYCFAHGLPYAEARRWKHWYDALPPGSKQRDYSAGLYDRMQSIEGERDLRAYLPDLKNCLVEEQAREHVYQRFLALLEEAKRTVAYLYARDETPGSARVWTAETVNMADLERILCSGIPSGQSGNLKKMSASRLNRCFRQKRMSRQRLEKLVNRKVSVDRFDLITLQFFVSAPPLADEKPSDRCRLALDEINVLLADCHMHGLYPVDLYEAFILMCLLSEEPLLTYAEVWELSYREGGVKPELYKPYFRDDTIFLRKLQGVLLLRQPWRNIQIGGN